MDDVGGLHTHRPPSISIPPNRGSVNEGDPRPMAANRRALLKIRDESVDLNETSRDFHRRKEDRQTVREYKLFVRLEEDIDLAELIDRASEYKKIKKA